jgi:multidrug efflux pump subunit AcrA (membrane-fusion protein)
MVFVVTDGRAVTRTVETGWQNDGWIAILSGLEVGEPVVTEGQTQLSAGATVDVL